MGSSVSDGGKKEGGRAGVEIKLGKEEKLTLCLERREKLDEREKLSKGLAGT